MHKNINVNVSGPVQPTATYKTVVLKGNHSFASQVTEPNMKYVIKHNFDLGGESVTIPENCVLEFEGGSLSNGTIVGNNTGIQAGFVKIFNTDITLAGSWNVATVYPEWFYDGNGDWTMAIKKACELGKGKTIELTAREYKIHGTGRNNSGDGNRNEVIVLYSNTTLLSKVKSRLYTDDWYHWLIFSEATDPTNCDYGITIDGIYFDQTSLYQRTDIPDNAYLYIIEWGYNKNITVQNCKFTYCARNCVKISGKGTYNVKILNNEFEYLQGVWQTNDNTCIYLRGVGLNVSNNKIFSSPLNKENGEYKSNYKFATGIEFHGPINICEGNEFYDVNTCIMFPSVTTANYDANDWDLISYSSLVSSNKSDNNNIFVNIVPDEVTSSAYIKNISIQGNYVSSVNFVTMLSTNSVSPLDVDNILISDILINCNTFNQIPVLKLLSDLPSVSFIQKNVFVNLTTYAKIEDVVISNNTVNNNAGVLLCVNRNGYAKIKNVLFDNNIIHKMNCVEITTDEGTATFEPKVNAFFNINAVNGYSKNIIISNNIFEYNTPKSKLWLPFISNSVANELKIIDNHHINGFNYTYYNGTEYAAYPYKKDLPDVANFTLNETADVKAIRQYNSLSFLLSDSDAQKVTFPVKVHDGSVSRTIAAKFGNLAFYGNPPSSYNSNTNYESDKTITFNNALPYCESTDVGEKFFDKVSGKPAWWNGTTWVDATGATV